MNRTRLNPDDHAMPVEFVEMDKFLWGIYRQLANPLRLRSILDVVSSLTMLLNPKKGSAGFGATAVSGGGTQGAGNNRPHSQPKLEFDVLEPETDDEDPEV